MKIEVDRGRCSGIGICESIAPEVFEISDDGALMLLHDTTDSRNKADVTEAVRACPARALGLVPPPTT